MSKKKKTRRQKVLADKRHMLYHLESPEKTESRYKSDETPSVESLMLEETGKTHVSVQSFAYVKDDIKKILILTSVAVAVQTALFFLLLGRI